MELTLQSALSSQGVLGHLAYVALVVSMLMRAMTWLRVLVIVSACLAVAYGALILSDPVTVFWESLLIVVNLVQLLISHWRSLRARFSEDEKTFVARHLPGLTRGEARDLIDRGQWRDLPDGSSLTVEGQPVSHLSYVSGGLCEVTLHGVRVSDCRPGDFVGEMTALTSAPATATVRARGVVTVWQIDAEDLRVLVQRRDPVAREIDAAFARNYREKIVLMNRLVAGGHVPG